MKTLKIEIPEGYEIYTFDKQSGEIRFKQTLKNIFERIKTIDDVIRELGDNDNEVVNYKKLLHIFPPDSHIVNNQLAVLITKAMNEGWVPNLSNPNEYSYYPWFEMDGSSGFRFDVCVRWDSGSVVGSRLCFKSNELAKYAGKQFTDVYRQFMI